MDFKHKSEPEQKPGRQRTKQSLRSLDWSID